MGLLCNLCVLLEVVACPDFKISKNLRNNFAYIQMKTEITTAWNLGVHNAEFEPETFEVQIWVS